MLPLQQAGYLSVLCLPIFVDRLDLPHLVIDLALCQFFEARREVVKPQGEKKQADRWKLRRGWPREHHPKKVAIMLRLSHGVLL